MNKFFIHVALITFACLAISSLGQASVTIAFIEGEKFTDYQISGKTRSKSLESLKKELAKLFESTTAKVLTEDHLLEVNVTNIDLAGNMEHDEIRVKRTTNFLKFDFNYRVIDNNGDTLLEGEHKIKEFTDKSLRSRNIKVSRGNLGELKMPLKKWTKATFTDY